MESIIFTNTSVLWAVNRDIAARILKVIGSDGVAVSVSVLMMIKLRVQSNDVVLVHVHEFFSLKFCES